MASLISLWFEVLLILLSLLGVCGGSQFEVLEIGPQQLSGQNAERKKKRLFSSMSASDELQSPYQCAIDEGSGEDVCINFHNHRRWELDSNEEAKKVLNHKDLVIGKVKEIGQVLDSVIGWNSKGVNTVSVASKQGVTSQKKLTFTGDLQSMDLNALLQAGGSFTIQGNSIQINNLNLNNLNSAGSMMINSMLQQNGGNALPGSNINTPEPVSVSQIMGGAVDMNIQWVEPQNIQWIDPKKIQWIDPPQGLNLNGGNANDWKNELNPNTNTNTNKRRKRNTLKKAQNP